MTQSDTILTMLKRGPVTPLEALHGAGCFRLAARVKDLRDRGHDIKTRIVKRGGSRFAEYYITNN
jgi:hypothetical protein